MEDITWYNHYYFFQQWLPYQKLVENPANGAPMYLNMLHVFHVWSVHSWERNYSPPAPESFRAWLIFCNVTFWISTPWLIENCGASPEEQ